MPFLYKFDLITGEYLSKREAAKRPNGEFILEASGHTATPPPECPDGYAPVWNGTAWEKVEDHRQKRGSDGVIIEGSGTAYYMPGDDWRSAPQFMTKLGALPEGAFLEKPQKGLEDIKVDKQHEIMRMYDEALVATLTMPVEHPSTAKIAVETALFVVDDAEGLSYIVESLSAQRDALLAKVTACTTLEELAALEVTFPV